MFDLYTKTNCVVKSLLKNDNIFEADEIVYGLYLGNINSVYDKVQLKKLGITHIISVIDGFIPPYPDDFNYLVINALDSENTDLSSNFEDTNAFISNAFDNNENILIHCQAGRSRSASIVISYLIKVFGISVHTCIDIIKSKRKIIEPNKSFVKQLELYYNNLYVSNIDMCENALNYS